MSFFISSAQAASVLINSGIPAANVDATTNPAGWVAAFYQVAIFFSGILAFGSIVYGGFLYATAAGNPSRESQGKDWIQNALFGVLLLAGAYLILYTVNPNLINLNIPISLPSSPTN